MLDANVFVSAAIRPSGTPGQIIAEFVGREAFDLVLSPAIIAEVEAVFGLAKIRKYIREPARALSWLANLVLLADLVQDTGRVSGVCRDAADDLVLGAAVEGRASALVTGDDDLLALGEYDGIRILKPRAFLDRLKGR